MRLRFPVSKKRCRAALKDAFGVTQFRPGQEQAVRCLLSGRDLLCLFPTGAGKSLCFQLPAVMQDGLTLVVSPLIALMRDQVRSLTARGIPALCLDSTQDAQMQREQLRRMTAGEVKLVYVSPERLSSPAFRAVMQQRPPELTVVDEAHCVVQWGREFRPAYRDIAAFLEALPQRPVVCAMTATADAAMCEEIVRVLELRRPKRIVLPLIRENLTYRVVTTISPFAETARLCRETQGKGIVFCRTRHQAETMAASLRGSGVQADFYHAGLDAGERLARQERFTAGGVRVLTATTAFGMGVDIPDIRFVIHAALPEDMIDLMQLSGRAGRDGRPACVTVLLDPADVVRRKALVNRASAPREAHRRERNELSAVLDWTLNGRCLMSGLSRAFGQQGRPCGRCSACLRAARAGRFTRLAPMPPLETYGDVWVSLWAMRWERDALAKAFRIPKKGCSIFSMAHAARGGALRCDQRWRGVPESRMNALLTHLRQ